MSLIFQLASRNLFHDRLRLIATIIGIVFSIVLVTVQMGLYLGFGHMVTTMIEHASADLWVMPQGTKCFEDPSLLDERQRFRALTVNGVADATPVVIGFAEWRIPAGGSTPVFLVGSDLRGNGLPPWNLIAGSVESLNVPHSVAVDETYFDRLGITGLGATAEIRSQKVEVAAVTKGIRSFTTTPYVFTTIDRARTYVGVAPNKATYFLIRVAPGANVTAVRTRPEGRTHRCRDFDAGRVSRPQPFVLAVRHRSRRGVVRGRPSRRHRRHGDCRPDVIFQHQRSPERVCHTARNRFVG